MKYTILNSDAYDIPEIIELFRLVWGDKLNKVTSKTKWAFESEITSKVLVLKNSNNEIISVRGGMKWPLIYNSKEIKTYQLHGTCVHPEYRRQGIFSNINKEFVNELTVEGNQLIFNVSVQNSKLGYEKLGWKYIDGFRRLTRFNKPLSYISNKLIPKSEENICDVKNPEENTAETIEVPDCFFIEREKQFKNLIHTQYCSKFLKWRLSNSQESYKSYETTECIIIYKIKNKELIIGEVFLKESKYKHFSKAIRELIKLENPDITYTYIFKNHPNYNYFLRYFFVPNPLNYNLNFGTRTLGDENSNILTGKNWGISFLDIDTF